MTESHERLEPHVPASGINPTADRSARSLLARLLLISAVVLLLIQSSMGGTLPPSGAKLSPLATTLSIHVVRTGSADASVLGVTDGVNEQIDVLVNGQVVVDKGKHTGARPGRALRHRARIP